MCYFYTPPYLKASLIDLSISTISMSSAIHNGKTRLSPAPPISENDDVVDHLSPGGEVLISPLDITIPLMSFLTSQSLRNTVLLDKKGLQEEKDILSQFSH